MTMKPNDAPMWLVQRSPTVTNWQTVYRSLDEAKAREVLARQLAVTCTGKFRLVDPAGQVAEMEYAKPLFAA
jgi:hypothetical protein